MSSPTLDRESRRLSRNNIRGSSEQINRSKSKSQTPLSSLHQGDYESTGADCHRASSPLISGAEISVGVPHLVLNDENDNGNGDPEDVEIGVQKAEILTHTWTRRGLHLAYCGLFLVAFITSLGAQVTSLLTPFATSEFHVHSLVATVQVVQGILFAVVNAPMAKIANTFGRLEAFVLALGFIAIGYLQMCLAGGVTSYASAQIFSASGTTGLLVLQQIFVADTTDLLNRALFSVLPDTPFLVTVWMGPWLADFATEHFSWRAGYGIWVLLLPLSASPLLVTLFQNQRRARRLGLVTKYSWVGKSAISVLRSMSSALDIVGILLLSAGCALVLIPLTLSSTLAMHWHDPRIPGMLAAGTVFLIIFVCWEIRVGAAADASSHDHSHRKPLLSLRVLKNRTVRCGCVTIFFYNMAYNIFQPYFFSYLMVSRDTNTDSAGKIVLIFSFAATISGILASFLMKHSSRYKQWLLIGIPIYQLSIFSMQFSRLPTSLTAIVALSQALAGVGGGMLSLASQVGVQASCNQSDVAVATALFLTVFSLGSAVGAAISGAIWTSLLPKLLIKYVPEPILDQVPDIYADFGYARRMFPDLDSLERQAIIHAYKDVMALLIWIAVAVTLPCAIASCFMREYNLEELSKLLTESRAQNMHSYGNVSHDVSDYQSGQTDIPIVIGSNARRTVDGDAVLMLSSDEEEDALGACVGVTMSRSDVMQEN
ncbi:major facilitator superfamily domain-containing protein [Lipomyces chichibuensis]|uniref:major facilitator superfamily domain-containing protein n=1 Tax=Lipomyces chichibuensis TaxID=1546026 RepID=UPI003343BE08